jgi:hypothetical protein
MLFAQPRFHALCSLLSLALCSSAHATQARPSPGAQNVRLKLNQVVYSGLKSGSYKVGASVPMALAFDLPQDTSCTVRVVFKPKAGLAAIPGKSVLTAQGDSVTPAKEAKLLVEDSALGIRGSIYQMSCGQFQVGSRVTVPFTFVSNANTGTGSAVDASVEVFGGKNLVRSIGYATLVMSADDNGVLRISSTEAINKAQQEKLFKNPDFQIQECVASEVLPLDEKSVPKALSEDVSDLAKDPSQ